jgi:hypothetical protein
VPAVRPRLPLILLGLALGLVLVASLGRYALTQQAEALLAEQGFTYAQRRDGLVWLRYRGLQGRGVEAESLEISLLPRPSARVAGVTVDLAALSGGAGSGGEGSARPWLRALRERVPVEVAGLDVRYGEDQVAQGLSGELSPRLRVEGPDASLSRGPAGEIEAALRRTVSWGPLSGAAEASLRCAEVCTLAVTMPAAVLSHPRLAKAPLGPLPLQVTVSGALGGGPVQGEATLGGLRATLSGSVEPTSRAYDLQVEALGLPLEGVVALFDRQIPEAAGATLRGTLGATLHLSGSPLVWSLEPQAEGLAAEGVIGEALTRAGGNLTWRAPAAGGEVRLRSTGPGAPGWVGLNDAGLVPAAFIAAEDAGFYGHRGYDLSAIREALRDAAADPEDLRGGSTISQQLAKNLFLDGNERTLCRKLRELLYALELDRGLGKANILELYVNIVELGPEIYGLREGADAYFLKTPARLSPREAAFLAAILRSPRTSYERAYLGGRVPNARIDAILDNMGRAGVLSPAARDRAQRSSLLFVPPSR